MSHDDSSVVCVLRNLLRRPGMRTSFRWFIYSSIYLFSSTQYCSHSLAIRTGARWCWHVRWNAWVTIAHVVCFGCFPTAAYVDWLCWLAAHIFIDRRATDSVRCVLSIQFLVSNLHTQTHTHTHTVTHNMIRYDTIIVSYRTVSNQI